MNFNIIQRKSIHLIFLQFDIMPLNIKSSFRRVNGIKLFLLREALRFLASFACLNLETKAFVKNTPFCYQKFRRGTFSNQQLFELKSSGLAVLENTVQE